MKKHLNFILFFLVISVSVVAQDSRYKGIQGIGYLHTQTALILNNWDKHPLNHRPMDKHEEILQKHFIEEFEHDEEWVDIVLVESNLFEEFENHIDEKVEDAIKENLEFYLKVLKSLRNPEEVTKNHKLWSKELIEANIRLYDVIYPALCK